MEFTRTEAMELLHRYIKNEKMLLHCYASEAVLKALAKRLGQDEEKWGLAGLLHDIDVEVTHANPKTHGPEAANLLKDYTIDPEIIDAICMHNEMATGKDRTTVFQHALAAGETITGLIFATTYVYPDRKLTSVKTKSVVKRMKEKAFAASVNRETIMECEKIGIPISEFADLAIQSMLPISETLGL